MAVIPIRQIRSTSQAQAALGNFSIREVSELLNGKTMVHELHRHNFFFLLALEKGAGIHEIDFVKHDIEDGSLFLLRPGQVHQLTLQAGSSGYLMAFDTGFYHPREKIKAERLEKAVHKNYCRFEPDRFKKLQAVLSHIFNEFNTQQEGYTEVIKAQLDVLFIEIIRQSRNPHNTAPDANGYAQERFEELMRLLEAHITRFKNVSQYTDLLHLSSYQLNAITKASAGKTVSDLINDQIILEAKRYLLATPHPIKEIADHLGYEDVSYFIRFFKKHTGHSPEAFRKNFK